jgi:hypothetical protein
MRRRHLLLSAALLVAVVLVLLGWNGRDREITGASGRPDSTLLDLGVDSCNENPRAEVEEGATQVRVRAVSSQWLGRSRDDCRDSVRVTLRSPLGDRQVVDFDDNEIAFVPAEE